MTELHRPIGVTLVVAASDCLQPAYADYICDGVDDQVEIQAAIDALPSITVPGGGSDKVGKVQLLEGIYNISATITIDQDGVILQGMGQGTATQHGVTLLREADGVNLWPLLAVTGFNCCLRDFQIDGNKSNNATAGDGLTFDSQDGSIENLTVMYCKRDGVVFGNYVAIYAKQVFSEFNDSYGFKITSWGSNFVNLISTGNVKFGFYLFSADRDSFSGCLAQGDEGGGFWLYDNGNFNNSFVGCIVSECEKHGFVISGGLRNSFIGCIVYNTGLDADNTWDAFVLGAKGANNTAYTVIEGCQIYSDAANKHRYGINEEVTDQDHNIYKNNIILNSATAPLNIQGLHNVAYDQYSDLFLDIQAVSTTHVINAVDISGYTGGETISPGDPDLNNQVDVKRNVTVTPVDAALADLALVVIVKGTDAKGNSVEETFTFAAGFPGGLTGNIAFAYITEVEVDSITAPAVGDTLSVGIGSKLGLSNIIYATGDVYKVTRTTGGAPGATAVDYSVQATDITVDATYHTVDMATGAGIVAGDCYVVNYKSNLNIVS